MSAGRVCVYCCIMNDRSVKQNALHRLRFNGVVNFQFKRATVQNHKTGALEPAPYRISKSSWLKSEEHYHVEQVSLIQFTSIDVFSSCQKKRLKGGFPPNFRSAVELVM